MSDNTNEIILEVKDLKKSFGDHVVLEYNSPQRRGYCNYRTIWLR